MSNSPVASGSGNRQVVYAPIVNLNVEPQRTKPAAMPPAHSTKPQKVLPNIVQTTVRSLGLRHDDETDVWSATDYSGGETVKGICIRFTNEARTTGGNAGAWVSASLVYRNQSGDERERISGCWVNDAYAAIQFRVERTWDLIVGIEGVDSKFYTVENIRTNSSGYSVHLTQVIALDDLQAGTLDVKLTDADSGDILYRGQFSIETNPLKVFPKNTVPVLPSPAAVARNESEWWPDILLQCEWPQLFGNASEPPPAPPVKYILRNRAWTLSHPGGGIVYNVQIQDINFGGYIVTFARVHSLRDQPEIVRPQIFEVASKRVVFNHDMESLMSYPAHNFDIAQFEKPEGGDRLTAEVPVVVTYSDKNGSSYRVTYTLHYDFFFQKGHMVRTGGIEKL